MRKHMQSTLLAFQDLLFILLACLAVLFIISFMMVNVTKKDADIKKPKAEFIVTLTWDYATTHDVDLWIEDPLGNRVFFNKKEKGIMHLDRDDLGHQKDTIVLPDGQIVIVKENQEIISIRGFIPGEWIINAHLYTLREDKLPVTVRVKVDKLNPIVQTVFLKELKFKEHWEEKTVCRFTMLQDGNVFNINYLPKEMVKQEVVYRSPSSVLGGPARGGGGIAH